VNLQPSLQMVGLSYELYQLDTQAPIALMTKINLEEDSVTKMATCLN
jgi:hypothetical protein